LLIDVAASGENVVEREGLSVRHPARFVLIGSGNPEEGELRPQRGLTNDPKATNYHFLVSPLSAGLVVFLFT
jgi:hypothetical protein